MLSGLQFLIGTASSGSGKTTCILGIPNIMQRQPAGPLIIRIPFCPPPATSVRYLHVTAKRQRCLSSRGNGSFRGIRQHARQPYRNSRPPPSACSADHQCQRNGLYRYAYPLRLQTFRPALSLAGAVFNRAGPAAHDKYLKQGFQNADTEALRHLPQRQEFELPCRHLDLNIDREFCFDTFAGRIAAQIAKTVNTERLLEIGSTGPAGGRPVLFRSRSNTAYRCRTG